MVRKAGTVTDVKVETKRKPRATRKPATKPKSAEMPETKLNRGNGPDGPQLKKEQLLADVSMAIVDRIKLHSSDWVKLGPAHQAEIRQKARDTANHLIKGCLEIVAGEGAPAVKAVLGAVQKHPKGHIEGKFSMSGKDEQRHLVFDHGGGGEVYVVIQDAAEFMDELPENQPAQDRLI